MARTSDRRTSASWSILLLVLVTVAAAGLGDPYRSQQWWLVGDVDQSAGAGQVIAVVDGGVDLDHPDLVDRLLRDPAGDVVGVDLVDGGPPEDPEGHGTMVAGIALATADNAVGVSGVAPGASLLPVRVLDDEGVGTATRVAEGVDWAVANGATVVNVSLEASGGDATALLRAPVVVAALRAARAAGVPVVVAAGNRGGRLELDVPVVLVGAHDRAGNPLEDSGGGPDVLVGPGQQMVSTWCRGASGRCSDGEAAYGIGSGTSFAAPVVAGLLARELAAGHDVLQAEAALRARSVALADPSLGRRLGPSDVAIVPEDPVTVGPADTTEVVAAPTPEPASRLPAVALVAVGVVALAVVLDRTVRR